MGFTGRVLACIPFIVLSQIVLQWEAARSEDLYLLLPLFSIYIHIYIFNDCLSFVCRCDGWFITVIPNDHIVEMSCLKLFLFTMDWIGDFPFNLCSI